MLADFLSSTEERAGSICSSCDHFLFAPLCFLPSFTWLSAQVHSNMVMHFTGRVTDSFDREFRCLYADSQVIECFSNPEEEGLACFPSYHAMMAPGLAVGFGPVAGLDLLSDRCVSAGWPRPASRPDVCCLRQAEAELRQLQQPVQ